MKFTVIFTVSFLLAGCGSTTTTTTVKEDTRTVITETQILPAPIEAVLPMERDTLYASELREWRRIVDSAFTPPVPVLRARRNKSPGVPGISVQVILGDSLRKDSVYINIDQDSALQRKMETETNRRENTTVHEDSFWSKAADALFAPLGIVIAVAGAIGIIILIIIKRR